MSEEKKCNWCNNPTEDFEVGKKYCKICSNNKYKECASCHRPYPNNTFFQNEESTICKTCENRKRKGKIESIPVQSYSSSEEEEEEEEEAAAATSLEEEQVAIVPEEKDAESLSENPLLSEIEKGPQAKKRKIIKKQVETGKKKLNDKLSVVKKQQTKRKLNNITVKKTIGKNVLQKPDVQVSMKIDDEASNISSFLKDLTNNKYCNCIEYFKAHFKYE